MYWSSLKSAGSVSETSPVAGFAVGKRYCPFGNFMLRRARATGLMFDPSEAIGGPNPGGPKMYCNPCCPPNNAPNERAERSLVVSGDGKVWRPDTPLTCRVP